MREFKLVDPPPPEDNGFTWQGAAVAVDSGLQLGEIMSINGSEDLSNIMTGHDGAFINKIWIADPHYLFLGLHVYQICVTGSGPHGLLSIGTMNVRFTSDKGETYSLSIWRESSSILHSNAYYGGPAMMKVVWGCF